MEVLVAEVSIQAHLEIKYLQQSDQYESSMIVLIIATVATVTVTMVAVIL